MEGSASQAGFYYQNNVAALKIIECLFFNSDITHVRLENYEKGNHIDDIIIYRKDRIEYYQIKWSNDNNKPYTLYGLLTASFDNKKSLFKQLAEGYNTAKLSGIDFSITLFTTNRESSQKRPSKGLNYSLSDIKKNVFQQLKEHTDRYNLLPNYEKYKETIEAIRAECALDEESFNDFIKKLEFKFGQESINQIKNAINFKLDNLGIETNLLEKFLDGVVNWSITGEPITKDLVLKQLGISDRFEDKLSHYFKIIDEKIYVPNDDLFIKLSKAISELVGGYILIEGLPGIGKSTALTKYKETNAGITLAYYCYIPDAKNDFGELRHKSYYFLKSLCISIEKQFPEVDLPNKYSENFEEKFALYINKLGTLRKKIIFIIDGLDHVHRDKTLSENSLLNQIKGNLPDGIYFILSSQYKAVLSSSVVTQIDSDPKRHIVVSKFAQPAIKQYLHNKGIDSANYIDRIERLSGGIPLYLHYISELLLKGDKSSYDSILDNFPSLIEDKINTYHEYLYNKTNGDEFARWVLAVLANRKENSTTETISQILNLAGLSKEITDVEDVINSFSHLLKQSNARAYSIFHNSFREFILSKTEDLKDRFNEALVLYYEQEPYSDEAFRNYFKHLNAIKGYQKIITTTNLDWIKSAWKNYRAIDEIKENLEIAINACVEILSLTEFIRIAFLKAQFDRLSWNIENSDIGFPTLLLNAGKIANSLRLIWDGDFILVNKEYFCYYLGAYYSKTGQLLPENILQQGFAKSPLKSNSDKVTSVLKAKVLAYKKEEEVFNEIDSIQWERAENHTIDYSKKGLGNKENSEINFKIKQEIIDFLYGHKKYDQLMKLSQAFKSDPNLFVLIQIALVKLFLLSEKKYAIKILSEMDLSLLSDNLYFILIAHCSDYLTNEEILTVFPRRDLIIPNLLHEVIAKEDMNYNIRHEITGLFLSLKPIWIYKPELVNSLLIRVPGLPVPAKNIYNSIFYLSELWNKNRTIKLIEEAKLTIAKQAIRSLYTKRRIEFKETHHGLMDMNNDDYFIASSIKILFSDIFNFTQNILEENSLEELVIYWLKLEESDDGYRHFTIALQIAKIINSGPRRNLTELTHKLIKHAEDIARQEEETATLISYIGEVAGIYGLCGFSDDFDRLYDQLIDLAFGVGYRKDYQTTYIISPLELIHKYDPSNTLKRLSEVFKIQCQLSNAGNGRMLHIGLSELISFTAKIYPELAFILLEKEENNIAREETIDMLLEPLIKKALKEDLPLYLSLIKTFPRLEKDSYFTSLSIQLLKRAIELKDDSFIFDLIELMKFNATVELGDITELDIVHNLLIENGKDETQYSLPKVEKEKELKNEKNHSKGVKFGVNYTAPSASKFIELFDGNLLEFNTLIQEKYEICLINSRIQIFHNQYYQTKPTFEKFFKLLPETVKASFRGNFMGVIRNYLDFMQRVVYFNKELSIKYNEFENLFNDFVIKTNSLFPDNLLLDFVENEFEKEKWIENILHFINDNKYLFGQVVSDEAFNQMATNVSIVHADALIAFIKKNAIGTNKSIAILQVVKRLFNINPLKAREILTEISEYESENLLFPSQKDSEKFGFDINESLLKADLSFGKRFLLKSYLSKNGKSGYDLIGSLDMLVKYQSYFDENNAIYTLYESNLLYNKELTSGLPIKNCDFNYISTHVEKLNLAEIIIKYLVGLFDYPAVKVREMTLQSVYDLITENSNYLKLFIRFGLENGTDNQTEHCIVVLQSISLKNPSILLPFKKELLSVINRSHFNISESIKELLLRLNNLEEPFLTTTEINILNKLNTQSPILLNRNIIHNQKGKHFIYSSFQVDLLSELFNNENDEIEIQDDLYTDLVSKGLGDYDSDMESVVLKRYNINTNFDTIEIQSPYYDSVKCSLNRIFTSKIKRGCYTPLFISSVKKRFRIYDPSKLLFKAIVRPEHINWISNSISESDFLEFKDLDKINEDFTQRESDYITLFEFGNQWPDKEYSTNQFTCYFDIIGFLERKGSNNLDLNPKEIVLNPYIKETNLHAYEIPLGQVNSSNFPRSEIIPLMELSENNFRGTKDLVSGSFISDIFTILGIEKMNLLEIIMNNANYPIKAFRWQTGVKSGGRRRYKPTSEGFTFKIERKFFLNYLTANSMVLNYDLKLKRSTTKNTPEKYMDWQYLQKYFVAKL